MDTGKKVTICFLGAPQLVHIADERCEVRRVANGLLTVLSDPRLFSDDITVFWPTSSLFALPPDEAGKAHLLRLLQNSCPTVRSLNEDTLQHELIDYTIEKLNRCLFLPRNAGLSTYTLLFVPDTDEIEETAWRICIRWFGANRSEVLNPEAPIETTGDGRHSGLGLENWAPQRCKNRISYIMADMEQFLDGAARSPARRKKLQRRVAFHELVRSSGCPMGFEIIVDASHLIVLPAIGPIETLVATVAERLLPPINEKQEAAPPAQVQRVSETKTPDAAESSAGGKAVEPPPIEVESSLSTVDPKKPIEECRKAREELEAMLPRGVKNPLLGDSEAMLRLYPQILRAARNPQHNILGASGFMGGFVIDQERG